MNEETSVRKFDKSQKISKCRRRNGEHRLSKRRGCIDQGLSKRYQNDNLKVGEDFQGVCVSQGVKWKSVCEQIAQQYNLPLLKSVFTVFFLRQFNILTISCFVIVIMKLSCCT